MKNSKTVSFIIIAFNEEKTIKNCINSIQKQDFDGDVSILVVNDGSTDKTSITVSDMAKDLSNLKIINNKKNMGRGFSRKTGVDNSYGDYIAFIDADIQLPNNWLSKCLTMLTKYDACGGIAMPDGDVQYIYSAFSLKPKIIKHTTEITGSNGLYKSMIFKKVNFSENMKDGEDVDLTWKLKALGFKVKSVDDLIVVHKENKNYYASLKWLFESGIGANKLLWKFKKIRIPDLSFIFFIIIFILSIILSIYSKNPHYVTINFLYIWVVSAIHVYSRFYFKNIVTFILSVTTNSTLIGMYFIGRLWGMISNII